MKLLINRLSVKQFTDGWNIDKEAHVVVDTVFMESDDRQEIINKSIDLSGCRSVDIMDRTEEYVTEIEIHCCFGTPFWMWLKDELKQGCEAGGLCTGSVDLRTGPPC